MIHVTPRGKTATGLAAMGLAVTVLLAACSGGGGGPAAPAGQGGNGGGQGQAPAGGGGGQAAAPAQVSIKPAANSANVAPATPVVVSVTNGVLTNVSVAGGGKGVGGSYNADKTTWTSTDTLAFGTNYTVTARATNSAGTAVDQQQRFSTLKPTKLAYDAMAPLNGQTMGVGMPVRLWFYDDATDKPVAVTNKADVIKHISVRTSPEQQVGYAWFSSGSELHFRPEKYWQAHTTITVSIDLQGVQLTNGVYAKRSRDVTFTVGNKHVSVADTKTHRFLVYDGDKLVKNFPASMGKEVPGRFTKNGVHIVLEKKPVQHMDSTTFGLALDAGGYTANVKWATRISNNGEFVHQAEWSVNQQGHENVSHGCVNLSPANAEWFFNFAQPGDVVEVTGSPVPLTQKDGQIWDWTLPWTNWTKLT